MLEYCHFAVFEPIWTVISCPLCLVICCRISPVLARDSARRRHPSIFMSLFNVSAPIALTVVAIQRYDGCFVPFLVVLLVFCSLLLVDASVVQVLTDFVQDPTGQWYKTQNPASGATAWIPMSYCDKCAAL